MIEKITCDYGDYSRVLFSGLQKAVLGFQSVDKILKCDNSNENY